MKQDMSSLSRGGEWAMAKLLVNQPATGGELDPASLFCSCCSQRFSSAAKASEVELEVSSRSKHLLQLWGTNSPGLRPQNKKLGPPKHFPSLNPHRSRGNLLFYLFGSLVPTRVRVKMDYLLPNCNFNMEDEVWKHQFLELSQSRQKTYHIADYII